MKIICIISAFLITLASSAFARQYQVQRTCTVDSLAHASSGPNCNCPGSDTVIDADDQDRSCPTPSDDIPLSDYAYYGPCAIDADTGLIIGNGTFGCNLYWGCPANLTLINLPTPEFLKELPMYFDTKFQQYYVPLNATSRVYTGSQTIQSVGTVFACVDTPLH